MREQVCIVLNEREPSKARAAESLAARLKEYNITTSRVPADEHVLNTVVERCPRVLVLDYLLGDYTTGLDILNAVVSSKPDKKPAVYFLTDEPGISVAVEAMRLGALDYLALDNSQSINRLCRAIHDSLINSQQERMPGSVPLPDLADFVDNAPVSTRLYRQARTLAKDLPPVILLHGPAGSGKRSLAQAIVKESGHSGLLRVLDLETFTGTFGVAGTDSHQAVPACTFVPCSATIILNPEADNGDCHSFFCQNLEKLQAPPSAEDDNSLLIVCSSSDECRTLWGKLPGCEILNLPALSERREDIPFLAQKFLRETHDLCDLRIKQFPASLLTWLQGLDWPGNIAQLRACIMHAAISTTFSTEDPARLIEEQRALWEEGRQSRSNLKLNRFTAARVLELSASNYRIAAARLGCSPAGLRELIEGESR